MPIDVLVFDWGAVERVSELTLVNVSLCVDQSNQFTDFQGCLPVVGHRLSLHQKKALGLHLRDRNDSKGNRNAIICAQEIVLRGLFLLLVRT